MKERNSWKHKYSHIVSIPIYARTIYLALYFSTLYFRWERMIRGEIYQKGKYFYIAGGKNLTLVKQLLIWGGTP